MRDAVVRVCTVRVGCNVFNLVIQFRFCYSSLSSSSSPSPSSSHSFFSSHSPRGDGYIEMDINVHRFASVPKKALQILMRR